MNGEDGIKYISPLYEFKMVSFLEENYIHSSEYYSF